MKPNFPDREPDYQHLVTIHGVPVISYDFRWWKTASGAMFDLQSLAGRIYKQDRALIEFFEQEAAQTQYERDQEIATLRAQIAERTKQE